MSKKDSFAFAVPIRPGKIAEWKAFVGEILGPRHAEYEASRKRLGITRETIWLQQDAAGELLIFYVEGDSAERILHRIAESTEPFDLWLKRQLESIPGLSVETARSGLTTEKYLDYRAA